MSPCRFLGGYHRSASCCRVGVVIFKRYTVVRFFMRWVHFGNYFTSVCHAVAAILLTHHELPLHV